MGVVQEERWCFQNLSVSCLNIAGCTCSGETLRGVLISHFIFGGGQLASLHDILTSYLLALLLITFLASTELARCPTSQDGYKQFFS